MANFRTQCFSTKARWISESESGGEGRNSQTIHRSPYSLVLSLAFARGLEREWDKERERVSGPIKREILPPMREREREAIKSKPDPEPSAQTTDARTHVLSLPFISPPSSSSSFFFGSFFELAWARERERETLLSFSWARPRQLYLGLQPLEEERGVGWSYWSSMPSYFLVSIFILFVRIISN